MQTSEQLDPRQAHSIATGSYRKGSISVWFSVITGLLPMAKPNLCSRPYSVGASNLCGTWCGLPAPVGVSLLDDSKWPRTPLLMLSRRSGRVKLPSRPDIIFAAWTWTWKLYDGELPAALQLNWGEGPRNHVEYPYGTQGFLYRFGSTIRLVQST